MKVRLQKFLAESGVASRRGSEQLITHGRVAVNGDRVQELGTRVDPEYDHIELDGRPVAARAKEYVALYKPRGYLCSRAPDSRFSSLYDLLPVAQRHLYHVGRLDVQSEGLIFLTNDGEFCLRVTHPRYGIRKRYRVWVQGAPAEGEARKVVEGVESDGERLRAESACVVRREGDRSILELELVEGRHREIRRLLSALGWKVPRLLRIQIGPVRLEGLKKGQWRRLDRKEVAAFYADPDPAPGPEEEGRTGFRA